MENDKIRNSCYKCNFLKHSLSHSNSLIYLCQKWGLKCNGIIPYKIVKDSIGRECPFFTPKQKAIDIKNEGIKDNCFDIKA